MFVLLTRLVPVNGSTPAPDSSSPLPDLDLLKQLLQKFLDANQNVFD